MGDETPLDLGKHFSEFIQLKIAEGRYDSATDVVRAALRLLEREELQREALQAALDAGLQSGEAVPFNMDDYINRRFWSTD